MLMMPEQTKLQKTLKTSEVLRHEPKESCKSGWRAGLRSENDRAGECLPPMREVLGGSEPDASAIAYDQATSQVSWQVKELPGFW